MTQARLPISLKYNHDFNSSDLSAHARKRYTLLAAIGRENMVSVSELRHMTQMGNGTFYRHLHGLHTDFGIRTRSTVIQGETHLQLTSWGIIDSREFLRIFRDLV